MPPNTNAPSDQLSQIVERLNEATNVLVTVSADPSVDQLAACIGLTLALNKQGKHATAVFSGKVPSTIEFLQPERTIETNTNSLRDFIISLDKSKADKLRYKVEDDFVKIFITPYRTSIDDSDLSFSQGDFNIDLVITLGVHERSHLDGAIIAHGRILHDAPVISITNDKISELGSINWLDNEASSLCEMAADLVSEVDKNIFDAQIATALLTGMVAETDRFGNEKARPHTMSVSGVLMAAGASPQLIQSKLVEPEPEPEQEEPEAQNDEPSDEIPEVVQEDQAEEVVEEAEEKNPEPKQEDQDGTIKIDHGDDIHIDTDGRLKAIKDLEEAQAALKAEAEAQSTEENNNTEDTNVPNEDQKPSDGRLILDPPTLGGQLTANSIPEHEQYSDTTDPLSKLPDTPLLDRNIPQDSSKTLTEIEESVGSHHLTDDLGIPEPVEDSPEPPSLDEARAAVEEAVQEGGEYRPEPISALGATPVDLNLEVEENKDQNIPEVDDTPKDSGNTPPPVPPPMMPPTMQ